MLSLRGDTILHKDCKLLCSVTHQTLVRRDLEIAKQSAYNSTQEMFLSQVGIQNSFVEDNEMITKPFFVSTAVTNKPVVGKTRNSVCIPKT